MKKIMKPVLLSGTAVLLLCGCSSFDMEIYRSANKGDRMRRDEMARYDKILKNYKEPDHEVPTRYASQEAKDIFHSLPYYVQSSRLKTVTLDTKDTAGAAVRLEFRRPCELRMVRTDANGSVMLDFKDHKTLKSTSEGKKSEPCEKTAESGLVNLLYALVIDPAELPKYVELSVQNMPKMDKSGTTRAEPVETIIDGAYCRRLNLTLRDNFQPYKKLILFPEVSTGVFTRAYVVKDEKTLIPIRITWTERDGISIPSELKISNKPVDLSKLEFTLVPVAPVKADKPAAAKKTKAAAGKTDEKEDESSVEGGKAEEKEVKEEEEDLE